MAWPTLILPGIAYPRKRYPTEYTLAWTKLYPDLIWTGYSKPDYIPVVKAAQALLVYYYGLGQFKPRGILWPEGV